MDCDLSAVHQALQATRLPARSGLDRLAHRALALTREHPPSALAKLGGFRLPGECAAAAFPFPYMHQSAQAQDRLAHAAAASTSDLTPSNSKRAGPAPHSTPRPPRTPRTPRDKPQPLQLRCAIRYPSPAEHTSWLKWSPARVRLSVSPILSSVAGSLWVCPFLKETVDSAWGHVRRRCACRLCSDCMGKEPIDNWELSAPRSPSARLRRLLRASAAAAMCALGAMVVQIAFEAPDAPDSLLERWIEAVTGDIL